MGGQVILMIATSLDGYIADSAGGVAWLEPFDSEEVGMAAFLAVVDVVVLGRRTYDQLRAMDEPWPYAGKRVEVLTRRPLDDSPPPGVRATGDLQATVRQARQAGRTVWICGGRSVIAPLLAAGLIDEVELYTVPVILGRGIPLWEPGAQRYRWDLLSVEGFRNGLVRSCYQPRNEEQTGFC
ncbi:dihydrofolate reductase family protein [Insolitispirillum peregrinum]|uniref:dihydrofolate reductase family protein n=1 Tax=Insolitispirillum peregrinum TaxID=80876 RepID=UPI00360A4CF3